MPVYEQIRAQVSMMVASGSLAPRAQLPTIRQLASDLGLAKGTVAKAYEALMRDQVITSNGRHGTAVADGPTQLSARERSAKLDEAAIQFVVTVGQLGATQHELQERIQKALRSVGLGDVQPWSRT